jgi:acylphosphatase
MAQKFGLTGYARNRENLTYAVTPEGIKRAIVVFTTMRRRGPVVSFVANVTESWSLATGEFESFDVLY